MKSYKIYFKQKDINPTDFNVFQRNGIYFIKGIKIKNETIYLNQVFDTENELLDKIKNILSKFGDIGIEDIK